MTLEKDKEDQIKYCIGYPKPLVVDVNWEDGDTNVVERGNIPTFSKLHDTLTSFSFLESFFDGVLVDIVVGYNKFTIIEKKQILFSKLLMKKFTYSLACYCLVGDKIFQTKICIAR